MFPIQSTTDDTKLYVDDVFSTWLFNTNGTEQTVANGFDYVANPAMLWIKGRTSTNGPTIYDTTRGATKGLNTTATNAEFTIANSVKQFLANGFVQGVNEPHNFNPGAAVAWTFRNAPKFFTHTTKSHTTGTASTVDLSSLGTVGMVVVKRTDSTSNWFVWHRSQTAGNLTYLNLTNAQTADTTISVSGTTLTITSATATGVYVIYAWAHDTASDGMVQCGSFTTDASGNATVTLGWEPQFVLTKVTDQAGNWLISDSLRGMSIPGPTPQGAACVLKPNATDTEVNPFTGAQGGAGPTPTGFDFKQIAAVRTFVYLAIRMPNKPPTSGTEVFQPVTYTGTGLDNRLVNTGIKTDLALFRQRNGSGAGFEGFVVGDRLRGQPWLRTGSTVAEATGASDLDQQLISATQYGTAFSSMTGVWVGNNAGTAAPNINANTTTNNHIVEAFKRAPGFMDIVCYTGTTSLATNIPHQLGVVPELMIVGYRAAATNKWAVYHSSIGNGGHLVLNSTAATDTSLSPSLWNNTSPTSAQFTVVGTNSSYTAVLVNGGTHVAYLFATLPGISKVGSYTGNGTSQMIDCGFTTGARFVMIKRTDSTGNWYVFDTARGYSSSPDAELYLNGTSAEVNSNNRIYAYSTGFGLAIDPTVNASGATYIYLAIA